MLPLPPAEGRGEACLRKLGYALRRTLLQGADTGRYVMHVTFEQLPSPLMGEGSGGGEDSTSSPPSPPSPAKGEGVLTSPCQPRGRGDISGVAMRGNPC
jgi:hypothetical protein